MTDVPPAPNSVPSDMKIMNSGVAKDAAVTIRSLCVSPKKNVSARLYTITMIMAISARMLFFMTILGIGSVLKVSIADALFS